jgi:DnaJ-class molecular chaperone
MSDTNDENGRRDEPALEEACAACSGVGSEYGRNGRVRCAACNGSGLMPTAFGERVLAMVRRHAHPPDGGS